MQQSNRKRNRGRPPIDWDGLFNEWLSSKKPKAEFLRSKGIDPTSGAAKRNTRGWTADISLARRNSDTLRPHIDTVTNIQELRSMVSSWRNTQSKKDYLSAEKLRQKAESLMDTAGTPSEIKALAITLEKLQKIQRLALGLSTENVSELEKTPPTETGGPIFIVEINKNGKFVRPRPRMVSS